MEKLLTDKMVAGFQVDLQWVASICCGWLLGGFMLLGNLVVMVQLVISEEGVLLRIILLGEEG